VTGISPNSGSAGTTVQVTITGTGFAPGAAVSFENGAGPSPDIANVVVVNSTTITASIIVKNGGPPRERIWDVRVTNPNSSTDVLIGGFTVFP
jgi:hypothetical protein